MNTYIILIIITIISVTAIIIFYLNGYKPLSVFGGRHKHKKPTEVYNMDKNRQIFIDDNTKLVVDGNNMVHDLLNSGSKIITFNDGLSHISDIMESAFPSQDIHIIIKNPPAIASKSFKQQEPSAISHHKLPSFSNLIHMSKKHPTITYHLAYSKNSKSHKKQHYLKGRDDFLTIYLSDDPYTSSYMISRDRFRDFKQFAYIKPFKHYSVKNMDIKDTEEIIPSQLYNRLLKPTVGNHFIYKLLSEDEFKKNDIKNGDIYIDSDSVFAKIYLKK